MDELKRTSAYKLKQALFKFSKEQKKDTNVEVIEEIPVPSPLKISTITFCFNIGTINYLNIISRYIPIYDIDSPEVLSNIGQITHAKHIYSLPRGWTDKKPKTKKGNKKNKKNRIGDNNDEDIILNTKFPNQVTITFRYCGLRNISIMIFSNGAIKMAGALSYAEGKWVSGRIVEILKNIKIKIYNNYNELPKENNHINDFNVVINQKTKNIRTYRWIEIDNYTSWVPTDTMIANVVKKIGDGLASNSYWHDVDVNFDKMCYINKIKEYIENDKINIDSLPIPNSLFENMHCLNIIGDAQVNKLNMCMINSDFNFFFYIKSDVLRDLLTNKYKIDSSYGVQGYNAVKSQYKWNPKYTDSKYPGMCQCDELCYSKNKSKNKCKIITISVFQNGNSIITGATNIEQLKEAHNFIIKIVKDNYDALYKKEPYTSRKKVVSGRTNSKNKKRTVIMIRKQNIANVDAAVPIITLDPQSDDEMDEIAISNADDLLSQKDSQAMLKMFKCLID
jgi:TATA-box binding protein (TBP) (component of TFIID and TFIIIB)